VFLQRGQVLPFLEQEIVCRVLSIVVEFIGKTALLRQHGLGCALGPLLELFHTIRLDLHMNGQRERLICQASVLDLGEDIRHGWLVVFLLGVIRENARGEQNENNAGQPQHARTFHRWFPPRE